MLHIFALCTLPLLLLTCAVQAFKQLLNLPLFHSSLIIGVLCVCVVIDARNMHITSFSAGSSNNCFQLPNRIRTRARSSLDHSSKHFWTQHLLRFYSFSGRCEHSIGVENCELFWKLSVFLRPYERSTILLTPRGAE